MEMLRHSSLGHSSVTFDVCCFDWRFAAGSAIVLAMDDFPASTAFWARGRHSVLDCLFLAMFVVVVVLGWSVYQVKYRRRLSASQAGADHSGRCAACGGDRIRGRHSAARLGGSGGRPDRRRSVPTVVWTALYVHLGVCSFVRRFSGRLSLYGHCEIIPIRPHRRSTARGTSAGAGSPRSTWC